MTPDQIHEFELMVGHKLSLLAVRAHDPQHPVHHLMRWNPETGKALVPSDGRIMAALLVAALNEPEAN
jgi:hypothetical protein